MQKCPCGQQKSYTICCETIHNNPHKALTAEQLMRARYSAFSLQKINFLYDTYYPTVRSSQSKTAIQNWARENKWLRLEILESTQNHVEFKAFYINSASNLELHHEISTFKQLNGSWYYLAGEILN